MAYPDPTHTAAFDIQATMNRRDFVVGAATMAITGCGSGSGAEGVSMGGTVTPPAVDTKWVVQTFAGVNGWNGSSFSGSFFEQPLGLCIDSSGTMRVSESNKNRIQTLSPLGVTSNLAGDFENGTYGRLDGTGATARFYQPLGMAVDSQGNVFVADCVNNLIRKISPAGVVTTFAGSGNIGSADGVGTSASFDGPSGIAIDTNQDLFVADALLIRKVSTSAVVSTFAGTGTSGTADGTGTNAEFRSLNAIAIDHGGTLYVTDDFRIRKITPDGVVTTIAGSDDTGSADGTGTGATFRAAEGIAVDASGQLFVADSGSNCIRKIAPDGVVTTIAGSYYLASELHHLLDGTGTFARFDYPCGIVVDASGNLFVADQENNRIRKIIHIP